MNEQRKTYIDGIKGAACLFIMLGHFSGIYKYAQNNQAITCSFLKIITQFPISIITTERVWLYLFFVISGYLISLNVKDKKSKLFGVVKKCLLRFFRLAVPIFSTAFIILLIQNTIGFYSQALGTIVENSWMLTFYDTRLSFKEVILEPFHVLLQGRSFFNAPFWCLKEMYWASVIIYLLSYLNQYLINKKRTACLSIVACIVATLLKKDELFSCLLGMIICWNEHFFIKAKKQFFMVAAVAPVFVYLFDINNEYVYGISFALFLLSVSEIKWLKQFFSSNSMCIVGKISWGIYAFHWPVYHSVGMLMLMKLWGNFKINTIFIMMFSTCILLTFILASIYSVMVKIGIKFVRNF